MTVVSCLQFTTVSGLPTAAEELGSVGTDGNQTDRTTYSLTSLRPNHQTRIAWPWPFRCKSHTQETLIKMLNNLGAQSFGGYNSRYMAFTWEDARKFPSLVTSTSLLPQQPIGHLPLNAPKKPISLTPRENCQITDGNFKRMCSECPTVTKLGDDKIPSFINEVSCGQAWCSGKEFGRSCEEGIMLQKFYRKTGGCDFEGYEKLEAYTQKIRVCCKCMLWY